MFELLAEVRKMGIVESQFIVKYRTSAVYGGRFYVMMEHIASRRSLSQLASLLREMLRILIARLRSRCYLASRSKESTTATS